MYLFCRFKHVYMIPTIIFMPIFRFNFPVYISGKHFSFPIRKCEIKEIQAWQNNLYNSFSEWSSLKYYKWDTVHLIRIFSNTVSSVLGRSLMSVCWITDLHQHTAKPCLQMDPIRHHMAEGEVWKLAGDRSQAQHSSPLRSQPEGWLSLKPTKGVFFVCLILRKEHWQNLLLKAEIIGFYFSILNDTKDMKQTGFPSHPFPLTLYTICSATLYGCSVKRKLRSGLFKAPLRHRSLWVILVGETIACKRAAWLFKRAKCAKITLTTIGNNTEAKGNKDWMWAHMAAMRFYLTKLWLQDPFGHCTSLVGDKLKQGSDGH